jgi:hypothetical protein
MNGTTNNNNKNNDNSIFTKDILIIFMMIISMITNMIFNYLMFYNLNNNEKNENNNDNSKAIDIYQSKMNFENEIKIMKMNENYLNDQINTLESIVKESINQKQICLGLCW